jgi:hypothetical protein
MAVQPVPRARVTDRRSVFRLLIRLHRCGFLVRVTAAFAGDEIEAETHGGGAAKIVLRTALVAFRAEQSFEPVAQIGVDPFNGPDGYIEREQIGAVVAADFVRRRRRARFATRNEDEAGLFTDRTAGLLQPFLNLLRLLWG